ncbi:MAG TPA: tetratricopeptide repeat protein [Caulobacteraceae bacterium]|nr:tetratricopeptide repeat protein [Caulobacteraceae bacterium]
MSQTGDPPLLLRTALVRHAGGDFAQAETLYRRLLQDYPAHAQALGLLGLILSDGPRQAEAEQVLRRHLDLEPGAGASLHALGRIKTRQGREGEALGLLQQAAAALPRLAPAHNDLGACLHSLGRSSEALDALERAVALDPAYAMAQANRGLVLSALHRFAEAADALLGALALTPPDAGDLRLAILVQLAQAARKADRAEDALEPLQGEGRRQPGKAELAGEIALTLEALGRDAEARAVRNDIARASGLGRTGRSEGAPVTVLVLGAVGGGHTPTRYLVDDSTFRILSLTLLSRDQPDAPLGSVDPAALDQADVVFSTLGDVDHDEGQFAAAAALIAPLGKPVLNPPSAIAPTGRDNAAALFAGIAHLIVPPVERTDPAALAARRITAPMLVRPAGDHGGDNLVRIESEADKAAYLAGDPPNRLLISPFHDYRSPDGLWRKYRLVFVDRQVFAYHLAIGEHWLSHYWRADMGRSDWKRAEEARFMEDWRGVFGGRAASAAEAVARRLDLDYGGMDCALTKDGDLLLFEANACVLLHLDEPKSLFPYKHRLTPPIRDAFTRHVLRRAGKT